MDSNSTQSYLPNFILIGAQKSGTTSLWNILDQHPDIFMSFPKETGFFIVYERNNIQQTRHFRKAHSYLYTLEEMKSIYFKKIEKYKIRGDATPAYLHSPYSANLIKKLNPDAKLLAILRNPIDRAYSHYWFQMRGILNNKFSFEDLILTEINYLNQYGLPDEVTPWMVNSNDNSNMLSRGFYYHWLQNYYSLFNKDQIKVVLLDDIISNYEITIRGIFDFLQIPNNFIPEKRSSNNSGEGNLFWKIYKKTKMPKLLKALLKRKGAELNDQIKFKNVKRYPPLSTDTRRQLITVFREDIINLQDLLDRDLSHWLKA